MRDVKADYPTRPMVESYCRNLDSKMANDFTPLEMFKKQKVYVGDKIDTLDEQMFAARSLLKNHTEHITKLKQQVATKASKVMVEEVKESCKQYALNKDLKELYEKIVPPAAAMEQIAQEMQDEVDRLTEVVYKYDENLCIKANRQDVLNFENLLRKYVKKDKYKPFVETTEMDAVNLKQEMNDLIEKQDTLEKEVKSMIHEQVRKATQSIRTQPPDPNVNLQNLLIEAHAQEMHASGGMKASIKVSDPQKHVKNSLLEVLHSKATYDDLREMGAQKTNKEDSEMQMKSIDIMHKQLLQQSTVLLEVIKNTITTKHETETEKQQKQRFLLQQQAHILDWIARFDPQNINTSLLVMPKELNTLHNFSQKLVHLLPEFLDHTVTHRLKQVAAKNSYRYLSNSIDAVSSTARETTRDQAWTQMQRTIRLEEERSRKGFNRTSQDLANLPSIDSKLATISQRPINV